MLDKWAEKLFQKRGLTLWQRALISQIASHFRCFLRFAVIRKGADPFLKYGLSVCMYESAAWGWNSSEQGVLRLWLVLELDFHSRAFH